ncbi:MAG: hypothetical protein LUC98_07335, partial [Lachnospiraceae bacterium]|nr:hypothetical protein [Lachnospiraceae bacterium]
LCFITPSVPFAERRIISMLSEEIRRRELKPLQMIADNYEKIVLSMDRDYINSYEGIKSENLIDWLLAD